MSQSALTQTQIYVPLARSPAASIRDSQLKNQVCICESERSLWWKLFPDTHFAIECCHCDPLPVSGGAQFMWADYLVFTVLILVSVAIGAYHALREGKRKSTVNFLMGGKGMSVFSHFHNYRSCSANIMLCHSCRQLAHRHLDDRSVREFCNSSRYALFSSYLYSNSIWASWRHFCK